MHKVTHIPENRAYGTDTSMAGCVWGQKEMQTDPHLKELKSSGRGKRNLIK